MTAVLLARYAIDDIGETCHGEYVAARHDGTPVRIVRVPPYRSRLLCVREHSPGCWRLDGHLPWEDVGMVCLVSIAWPFAVLTLPLLLVRWLATRRPTRGMKRQRAAQLQRRIDELEKELDL